MFMDCLRSIAEELEDHFIPRVLNEPNPTLLPLPGFFNRRSVSLCECAFNKRLIHDTKCINHFLGVRGWVCVGVCVCVCTILRSKDVGVLSVKSQSSRMLHKV